MKVKLFWAAAGSSDESTVKAFEAVEPAINDFLSAGVHVHSVQQSLSVDGLMISIFYETFDAQRRPVGMMG